MAICALAPAFAAAQKEKPSGSGVNLAPTVATARANPVDTVDTPSPAKSSLVKPSAVSTASTEVKSDKASARAATTKAKAKAASAAAAVEEAKESEAPSQTGSANEDAGVAKVNSAQEQENAGAVTEEHIEPIGPLVVPSPPPPPVPASATPSAAASDAPPVAPPPPSVGVTYLNRAVFLLASDGTKVSKERAKRLSEALKAAIEAENKGAPDAPNVELVPRAPDQMELRVRGYVVGELWEKDAIAARQPDLPSYARALDEGLELFVADQRRKIALQGVAVRVAIALVVSIVGLFFLRLAQALFHRADEYIDEHSGSIRPFKVLGVPVIGVEGLSAAITFTVAIGRIATLMGIVIVTIAVALAQFELTRPWITVVTKWSTARVLSGIEELVLILPRLLLATALVLTGSAAVRVARVLFDDTTTTATPWGTVSRRRARVLRVLVPVGVFVLVVPLAVAAVFGRFHTPLELLILALVLGASLGLAPLVAAGGMGLAATWHGVLLNGDHITIGDKRGRVVRMNPFWVELEDENGMRKDVPLLSLVNASITHHLEPAPQRLSIKIKRPPDIPAALESVEALVKTVCAKRNVECVGFDAEHAEIVIEIWAETQQTAELVRRLADPNSAHPVLELTRLKSPDMVRGSA